MKKFLIALQFLTTLPIKVKSKINPQELGQSLIYFPIVGALIGSILALCVFAFHFLPTLVVSILVLMISIVITGGIHLDGFADTCDGFYSTRNKVGTLKIMHDSHVGVMGVIGLACLILLKFTLFITIIQQNQWKTLIIMAVFARWAQSLACLISKYARSEGKAKHFVEFAGRKEIVIGGLFTLTLFLLLANFKGAVLFTIPLVLIILFINYVKRKIGGMTGDTIGATNEVAEILILLFSLF